MTQVAYERGAAPAARPGLGRELGESALLFLLALLVTAGVAGLAALL